mmetsp:Transcript_20253/g.47978  ORF Transcript_20253/g.47978 Transcript_20253/m.47978 type:complete len:572 (+) Transcript_20253:38-1753(+)|eukprot:CAMPEP_0181435130 /NCGR_PEP_ID=MMETSP1110-20121109/20173_1 /TAXON_ID=174948 /ORGANISM="Symbiodinium sp., Strain CCMP421" /LENGTH=571 /DNA_ID=CAMNT_0023558653 /DNA_START=38 /DNA_END=1753 /DNA_ORIENTATION=-
MAFGPADVGATFCVRCLLARPMLRPWLLLAAAALAQQVDPLGDEDTKNAGIRISVNGHDTAQFVMLDSRWRYLYTVDGKSCASVSTDPGDMERCYLQGLKASRYSDSYGVFVGSPNNRAVTLRYATKDPDAPTPNYGSRVYLTDGEGYTQFAPLSGEISFDIDISKVPAGMNAAVYLVSMDTYGNMNSISNSGVMNVAGWRRGLGYCDAQCPTDLRFVQDKGFNQNNHYASCCPEMDLFEANRFVSAMTAHPCKLTSESVCDASKNKKCKAECDSNGADVNTFREYGPGHALFNNVDVMLPFTVTTRFITDNGYANGTLVEIEQELIQNGRAFKTSLTDQGAADTAEKFRSTNPFGQVYGGLAQMGKSLRAGMVLVIALWSDAGANMNWLDSCDANKTEYECEKHAKFDDIVWEQAQSVKPGIWRGPVDYYPDFAESFETKDVAFNYAGIPLQIKRQVAFSCRGCETKDAPCDCASVPYAFTVSNIEVTHQPPRKQKPTKPSPSPGGGGGDGSHLVMQILVPMGIALAVAACLAFLCCYVCSEDDVENVRVRRRRKKLVKCQDTSESSSDS